MLPGLSRGDDWSESHTQFKANEGECRQSFNSLKLTKKLKISLDIWGAPFNSHPALSTFDWQIKLEIVRGKLWIVGKFRLLKSFCLLTLINFSIWTDCFTILYLEFDIFFWGIQSGGGTFDETSWRSSCVEYLSLVFLEWKVRFKKAERSSQSPDGNSDNLMITFSESLVYKSPEKSSRNEKKLHKSVSVSQTPISRQF